MTDSLNVKYGDDIVLLVGAGASGYIGLPTLEMVLRDPELFSTDTEAGRIIQETRNTIEGLPNRVKKAMFEEIIARLREYQEISFKLRTDYLFSKELGQLPTDVITGSFERKWKRALTECYRILVDVYGPQKIDTNIEEYRTTLGLLEELAKLNSGNLHVYTTNYDCSYQVFSSDINTPNNLSFITHIDNTNGTFSENWYFANKDRKSPDLNRIFIHRLHGSIAWFQDDRNPFLIEEQYGAGDNLIIQDDEKLHRMAIKLVTFRSIGINPAFLKSFNELDLHLKTAKALVIWGYSFRDLEVLRKINETFSIRNNPLPIYSLNPFLDENEIINYIRETLRDVPVGISQHFRAKKIDWTPADGNGNLIKKTIETLTKEVM